MIMAIRHGLNDRTKQDGRPQNKAQYLKAIRLHNLMVGKELA